MLDSFPIWLGKEEDKQELFTSLENVDYKTINKVHLEWSRNEV